MRKGIGTGIFIFDINLAPVRCALFSPIDSPEKVVVVEIIFGGPTQENRGFEGSPAGDRGTGER